MSAQPLLVVDRLTIALSMGRLAYPVVENVSFTLEKGESVALVGESGCGKTMTGLALLRILPEVAAIAPHSAIRFFGENIVTLSEKRLRQIRGKRVAMIFQDPMSALNPVYSIGYQMGEVAALHLGLFGEEAEERIVQSLSEVGIPTAEEILAVYPHQISGGMKQRVMIAMALLCEPDLLIADEPTTALDVTVQAQILRLMQQLQKKKGTSILLITHDMGVVAEMVQRVMIMYAGQIVEESGVEELFARPLHPYAKGLFASRIALDAETGVLPTIRGSVPAVAHWPKGCRFHPRCPYCMEKCRAGGVPLFLPEKDHTALCWLYDGSEESRLKENEVGAL